VSIVRTSGCSVLRVCTQGRHQVLRVCTSTHRHTDQWMIYVLWHI